MELVSIFVDDETKDGLYSIHYEGEEMNEWERLMSLWIDDTEFITDYCYKNQAYFLNPHFEGASIDNIINKIRKEAESLEEYLFDFSEQSFKHGNAEKLQAIFRPLHNREFRLPDLQQTKFRVENRRIFPKPILRIYALRIGENAFAITGGAIKLTRAMPDHPDTQKELDKIEESQRYLMSLGITNLEQLILYYEQ